MSVVGWGHWDNQKTKEVFGLVVELEMEPNACLVDLVHDFVNASVLSSVWIWGLVMDSPVELADVAVI